MPEEPAKLDETMDAKPYEPPKSPHTWRQVVLWALLCILLAGGVATLAYLRSRPPTRTGELLSGHPVAAALPLVRECEVHLYTDNGFRNFTLSPGEREQLFDMVRNASVHRGPGVSLKPSGEAMCNCGPDGTVHILFSYGADFQISYCLPDGSLQACVIASSRFPICRFMREHMNGKTTWAPDQVPPEPKP